MAAAGRAASNVVAMMQTLLPARHPGRDRGACHCRAAHRDHPASPPRRGLAVRPADPMMEKEHPPDKDRRRAIAQWGEQGDERSVTSDERRLRMPATLWKTPVTGRAAGRMYLHRCLRGWRERRD